MSNQMHAVHSIPAGIAELTAAHAEVVAVIRTIPDMALDWQPSSDDWSFRQIVGHLAHANDFYVLIMDEVRASNFGCLKLHLELPGFQRMLATDAEVTQCTTVFAVLDCFEHAYQRMLAVLQTIRPVEFDQSFVLWYAWKPDVVPETTTLRQRVLATATSHIQEHQAQLVDTLARWHVARNLHTEAAQSRQDEHDEQR